MQRIYLVRFYYLTSQSCGLLSSLQNTLDLLGVSKTFDFSMFICRVVKVLSSEKVQVKGLGSKRQMWDQSW